MSSPTRRRLTRILAIVAITILTLVVGIVALLQIPPIATWAVRRLVTLVPLNPGYALSVGRVTGNWITGLELRGVRLLRHDRELARVDQLRVGYDPRRLRGPPVRIRELTVDGAQVVARREGDSWDLANALRPSADTTGGGGGFALDRLDLRNVQLMAVFGPDSTVRVRGLSLRARNLAVGDQVLLTVDGLNAAVAPPGSSRWFGVATRGAVTAQEFRFDPVRVQTEQTNIQGRVVLPRSFDETRLVDRLDVRLAARPLDLADLAALVPSVPTEGALQLDATAAARDNLVTAHLAATLDQARLTLDGDTKLERGSPTRYRIHGVVSKLDPSRLNPSAPAGAVNAELDAEVNGPPAEANGSARLRLDGSRIGTTVVRRLDLRALFTQGTADLTLLGALDTGTVSATGRARLFDSIPSYRFSGSAHRMPGTAAVARALAGQVADPTLAIVFRLSGEGTSPDSAMARGRVDLTAVPDSGERVPVGHVTLRLADGRLTLSPELLAGGGKITALGRVELGDTMSYQLREGRIDRVDLGKLSGDTVSAPLSGSFSLAGRGTDPAQARVTTRLHFDELRYGERRMERVDAVARLDRGRLRLDGTGAIQGGRLTLEASGRPFDSTASYVLRRAALDSVDLGTFLGRPDLAGPVTLHMTGEGRWRGEDRSARARLTLEPSRLGRVAVSGGGAEVRFAGTRLTYDASVRTTGGTLVLAGDGTPTADVPAYRIREGEITSLNLGTLLGRPDLRTDINSRFTAAVTGSSADSLRASLGMVLLPSRVNDAELSDGSLQAQVQGRDMEGKLHVAGRDAALDADINARGTEGQSRTALRAGGSLRIENLARWTGRKDADGRVESRFDLQAETDSGGLHTAAGTVNAVGGIGGVKVQSFHLAMSPAEGQLKVDTLQLVSSAGIVAGSGNVALQQGAAPGTLRLAGRLGDLGPVAALTGNDTVAFDSARINLAMTGPAWHWRVAGDADAYGLAYGGNLANRITLKAAATVDSTRLGGAAGELRVEEAAFGQLSLREIIAAGRYDSTLALDASLNLADSLRLAGRVRGVVSGDTVRAVLQRLNLDEGGRAWALERPANLIIGNRIEVDGLALRAGTRSIALNGIFDRRGSSDMTLRVSGLDLETLRATGLAPIGGRLDGFLHLEGPAAAPRLEGKVGLTVLSDRGRQVGVVASNLAWNRDGLRVNAAAKPARGGALTVDGTLPYRFTLAPRDTASRVGVERNEADTVALAVRADSFNLAFFQPLLPADAARGLQGLLQVNANIGGSIRAPEATGGLNLTRLELELPAIGITYERGEMEGRLEGDDLLIERLRLFTDKKEELVASGAVHLRPLSEPGLDLSARLQHFRLVNSNQLQTAASGQLRVGGTMLQPSLSGTLRLDRTVFFVGAQAAQAKVEQVELTPEELRELARDFGPAVLAHAKESPGLMDRVSLDLAIRMPRRVWIRRTSSPKTDIELAGRLRVTQKPGQEMQFFGQVEPVPGRGTLELNGRQFRLTEGDITLAGPVDSTKLDVNAEYQVPTQGRGDDEGVLINVHATGRLDSLALDFTADPTMSQDDILSYIVTGRPASDNPLFEGQGEDDGPSAGRQMAMSTLSDAISNAAGKGLGFDVFQIRQEPTRGLTLTAGRYLGSRLFLDLQLPLSSTSQQATTTNLGPGFELEYTLRRWLRANLRGGSLSPGFLFRGRYAY